VSPASPLRFDAPTLADAFGLPGPRARPVPPPLPGDLAGLLPLLAHDLTRAQIGAIVHLSESGVGKRLRHLYAALDVHSRAGAVFAAVECGLLREPDGAPSPCGASRADRGRGR